MKKENIKYIVLACIAVVALIIILAVGLNVDLKYRANKQVEVYIGKEFNEYDVKEIAKEVFGNQEILVQKVEAYGEIAAIIVNDITDEQKEELNTKINEKYGVDNTVEKSIVVTENAKLRIGSLVRPYILPIAVSLIIILVYAAIRFRKIEILEVLGNIFGFNIASELLFLSILAIFRLPVNTLTLPTAIIIYVLVTLAVFNNFETREEKLREQEKKRK